MFSTILISLVLPTSIPAWSLDPEDIYTRNGNEFHFALEEDQDLFEQCRAQMQAEFEVVRTTDPKSITLDLVIGEMSDLFSFEGTTVYTSSGSEKEVIPAVNVHASAASAYYRAVDRYGEELFADVLPELLRIHARLHKDSRPLSPEEVREVVLTSSAAEFVIKSRSQVMLYSRMSLEKFELEKSMRCALKVDLRRRDLISVEQLQKN